MRAAVWLAFSFAACKAEPAPGLDAWSEPPGLIAHYALDDATLASQPPGLDGACTPCPIPIAGHLDGALLFDGRAIVTLPPAVLPPVFSVSIWVRVDARTPDMAMLAEPYSATTRIDTLALRYEEESSLPSLELTPDGVTAHYLKPPIGRSLADAAWHHLAVTFDGTTLSLYSDGALFGARATTLVDNVQPVLLGGDLDDGAPVLGFRGALDELRFYDRALSPDEVAGLAAP
jgi:hypothetical protein